MAITINVNGESINYPQTGDTNWSDEATDFAVQTASAFGKIGLASGTTVDLPGTLDVTGSTTLDSTLTVAGTTTLNSTLTVAGTTTLNGNTNLGNATSDIITIIGAVAIDTNVLVVNPTTNRVGINVTSPTEALDITGNIKSSGNLTINGNTTLGDASGDSLTINGTAVSVPNGLNIDSDTFVIDAANNRVGIGTSSPINGLDVNDNARVGTTGDFTGLKIMSKSDSSSVAKTSFLDSSNNLGITDSHILFVHNPDGSSTISLGTTPSGSRSSDRRVTRFNVAGDGQLSAVVPGGSTLYPGFLCRAWVNFNGTTASPSTRGSGNVSSVTKNNTGDYTINFATPLPDANYAVVTSGGNKSSGYSTGINTITTPTASLIRILNSYPGVGVLDEAYCYVGIFR